MSTSESGFDKNLSLYEQMLEEIKPSTANYNPPVESLSLETLESYVEPMKISLGKVKQCEGDYTFAINARQAAYDDMKKRITRVNDLLPLLKLDSRTMTDIKSAYNRIRGYSANSEQGFEHLKENFQSYLVLLKLITTYQTNDPQLSIEALDALDTELAAKDKAVSETDSALSSARDERNQLMFNKQTGIVPCCKSVKQYYRSQEGFNGVLFKRLVTLLSSLRDE